MTYFSKFPVYLTRAGFTGSSGTGSQKQIIMVDFFRRIRTGKGFSDVAVGLTPYFIADGETPEGLAYKYYGSAFYHWVILLVNDIIDVRQEWPLDTHEFDTFIRDKYGDIESVHHYIDPETGYEVDSDFLNAQPVKNREYEEEINEAKRNIRLLDPKYLQQFVSTFDSLIRK